jgi:hypothetical protein
LLRPEKDEVEKLRCKVSGNFVIYVSDLEFFSDSKTWERNLKHGKERKGKERKGREGKGRERKERKERKGKKGKERE